MSDSKPIALLGAGGHAGVLSEILRLLNRTVLGVVAPSAQDVSLNLPYLGTDEDVLQYNPAELDLVCGIGSDRLPQLRSAVFHRFFEAGFYFANVIHPMAFIAKSVRMGTGAQLMAGAIVSTNAKLGDGVLVNTGAIVDHDCVVADLVHIATGARLAGGVTVGQSSHIGAGATLIQGVNVGKEVVVGAGAVVVRDVPDGLTVVGVPARPIGDRL